MIARAYGLFYPYNIQYTSFSFNVTHWPHLQCKDQYMSRLCTMRVYWRERKSIVVFYYGYRHIWSGTNISPTVLQVAPLLAPIPSMVALRYQLELIIYLIYNAPKEYKWRSLFPKHVKRQSKNWCCDANERFGGLCLGKNLFINMYNYTHINICEKLFTKTPSLNLTLALQAHFLELRLTRFGKELFIYRCSGI